MYVIEHACVSWYCLLLVTGTYFLSFFLRSLNQQCKEKKEEVLEENVERQPHVYTNLPIRDEHKT